MGYMCPVCGYTRLPRPPEDYLICSCCGTEFGYDDFADNDDQRERRWIDLRRGWLERGAPWFSVAVRPPANWNPYVQLLDSRLAYDLEGNPSTLTSTDVVIHR